MTAKELADRIEACDHMVMWDSAPNPDDDMIQSHVSADDHNLIVEALRNYETVRATMTR